MERVTVSGKCALIMGYKRFRSIYEHRKETFTLVKDNEDGTGEFTYFEETCEYVTHEGSRPVYDTGMYSTRKEPLAHMPVKLTMPKYGSEKRTVKIRWNTLMYLD